MNNKIPQNIRDQLPEDLKILEFTYLPQGYWYGITKKKEGIRIYIEKDSGDKEVPRIERSELQETGQMGAGVWFKGLKDMFKRK